MDTAPWPQDIGLVKPMDQELVTSGTATTSSNNNSSNTRQQQQQVMERRVRPQKEQALNCPRCNSTNTKFCYYNNYSLTQPRYFCKTCRRYWTEGGSLRNVPVGGGSRKNKIRSTSSSSSSTSTTSTTTTSTTSSTSCTVSLSSSSLSSQNPKLIHHEGGQDLNLAFPVLPEYGDHFTHHMETNSSANCTNNSSTTTNPNNSHLGLEPFMPLHPMPMVPEFSSGFGVVQDFRSNTLSFPLDGIGGGSGGGGYGSLHGVQESAGRLLFPFHDHQDSRHDHVSSNATGHHHEFEQNRGQAAAGDPPGFWNGMIGGGGSW